VPKTNDLSAQLLITTLKVGFQTMFFYINFDQCFFSAINPTPISLLRLSKFEHIFLKIAFSFSFPWDELHERGDLHHPVKMRINGIY